MITDARTIPADTTIKTDLCIVGAGAAGITIARELIGEPIQVCLLEAGGLESDAVSSSMNAGENVGLPYFPLDETRSRHFGGGTNLWAGWCRPLEALDLETRPWVPASGWPISLDTLNPYYRRAQQLCDIPTYQYEATAWRDRLPELYRIRNLGPDTHVTVWQASPPTRFGREFRDEIRRAANVHTYLYANVSELETNETGTAVTRARVACIGGKTLRVDARIFVLAAGGIETPRILLLSSRFSADGLGNQHGNVGRFFMEHPHVVTGRLKLTNRAASRRETIAAIDRGPRGAMDRLRLLRPKGRLRCAFALSPDMQRAEQLLNYSAHLRPVATMPNDDAYKSLRLLVGNIRSFGHASRVLRNGKSVHEMRRHVARVIGSPAALATAAYREFVARPTHLEIYSQSEQSPNRNSGPGAMASGGRGVAGITERRSSPHGHCAHDQRSLARRRRRELSRSWSHESLRDGRIGATHGWVR